MPFEAGLTQQHHIERVGGYAASEYQAIIYTVNTHDMNAHVSTTSEDDKLMMDNINSPTLT